MGNFSKDPLQVLVDNLQENYLGVHLQQGVPVLDRDINLMQDLLRSLVQQLAGFFFGSGVLPSNAPPHTGFSISPVAGDNDFNIAPGSALGQGLTVALNAPMSYKSQTGVPALTTPTPAQPDPREDHVYLDVWLREVTSTEDNNLRNDSDIGIETSVRLKPTFLVRVAENTPVPAPQPGHVNVPLATLRRPRGVAPIAAGNIIDARTILVTLPGLSDRLRIVESLLVPVITGITPTVQNVNNAVTVSGNNFNQGTPIVTFVPTNAAIAPQVGTVVTFTQTQIQVLTPNFPGTTPGGMPVTIRVQTGAGSADSPAGVQLVILDTVGPTIQTITPPSQAVGQNITITGTDLTGVTAVHFIFPPSGNLAGINATIVSATATAIVVTVPSVPLAVPGVSLSVSVTTVGGMAMNQPTGPSSFKLS